MLNKFYLTSHVHTFARKLNNLKDNNLIIYRRIYERKFRKFSSLPYRVGFLGLLVTLGIVFGDIGTSPLYVMKAILHTGETINESTILGALSCIIWTLTLQTTIKYVCVALRADNNGEGGILALYALLRKMKRKWIYLLAIIGASTLLADGIITPAITVTTAIEGLESISPHLPVIPITLGIITIIFFVNALAQRVLARRSEYSC